MSINRSNRFFSTNQNVSGSTGWVHDHPYVYLLDSTDQVIIGANAPVSTEKLRVVGHLRVDDTGSAAGIALGAGQNLAVSAAGTARVRYNGVTNALEVSLNGAAYTPIGATAGVVYGVSGLQVVDLATFSRIGNFRFNPSDWPATATFTFAAMLDVIGGSNVECRLYNLTTSAVVAGSTLTTAAATPTYLSAAVAMAAGDNDYEVQMRVDVAGVGIFCGCGYAAIEVD